VPVQELGEFFRGDGLLNRKSLGIHRSPSWPDTPAAPWFRLLRHSLHAKVVGDGDDALDESRRAGFLKASRTKAQSIFRYST
jgi:hypothetical protein